MISAAFFVLRGSGSEKYEGFSCLYTKKVLNDEFPSYYYIIWDLVIQEETPLPWRGAILQPVSQKHRTIE